MSKFLVVKKKISKKDAKKLIKAIKKTNKISAYSLSEWINCNNVFAAYDSKGELLGACLNDDFSKDWTEIAALIVFQKYRGMGIGRKLFDASFYDSVNRGRDIMIMSNNPSTIHMMKKVDFEIYKSLEKLPEKYIRHRFTLNFWYELRWNLNFYRIFERIRKKIVFGKKPKMIYGLRLNNKTKKVSL